MARELYYSCLKYGDLEKLEDRWEWIDTRTGDLASADHIERNRYNVRKVKQVFIKGDGWITADDIVFNIAYEIEEYMHQETQETIDDILYCVYREDKNRFDFDTNSIVNESVEGIKHLYTLYFQRFTMGQLLAYTDKYVYFSVKSDLGHYYKHVPRNPDPEFVLDI